jgi:hypothetical protein
MELSNGWDQYRSFSTNNQQFCHDYVGDLSRKTNKIKPKNHETAVWL